MNTTADIDGPGLLTLRDAIAIADADTTTTALPITFDPTVFASSQTITLTNGTLTLGGSGTIAPITITGPSAGVTIDGAHSFAVFTVDGSTTATLSGLTITDGSSSGGTGGGIFNSGTLTVSASTLSGNSAFGDGGGIYNAGTLTVSASTLSGNSAPGGGIFNEGTLTVSASTLSGNSAGSGSGGGGGIANYGMATLNSDIIAGNMGDDLAINPVDPSSSYNLIGRDDTGKTLSGHNTVGVTLAQLQLAPLGYYGGPTETLALLPGSVAIGSGPTLTMASTDQRGVPRPINSPSDVGAYQFGLLVNSTADSSGASTPGLLTLRQAIAIADASTVPQPIRFDPGVFASSQTITLTNGTLTLGGSTTVAPITITGPSAGVTVSGNNSFTVFHVNSSVTATLSGLTIADGNAAEGGGIANFGTLTVSASNLSGNSGSIGGGIYNGGTLTVSASTLSGNSATGGGSFGGGIENGGTLTVSASTLSGNSASSGGGIYNGGTLNVSASTLSGNSAGTGGGILNVSTLTVSASTLSGNSAASAAALPTEKAVTSR